MIEESLGKAVKIFYAEKNRLGEAEAPKFQLKCGFPPIPKPNCYHHLFVLL